MNNININKPNLLPTLKTPKVFYGMSVLILFLIIMLFLIFFNVDLTPSISKTTFTKSQQEMTANILTILFFSLLVFGLSIIFLPNFSEIKSLFEQINSVTYVILYTIFVILFYTMVPKNIINDYSSIINTVVLVLGVIAFYKGISQNYNDKFNINYERIKMILLFFCLITLIITFYNLNPGGISGNYFGYSLLITIIIAVFAFLYVMVLMTLPGKDEGSNQTNLFSNFSSFGVYGSVLFLIFLIVMTVLINVYKESIFSDQQKAGSIITLMLIICVTWIILLGANLVGTDNISIATNFYKKSLLILFGLIISGLLIFWLTYNIENLSGKSSIVSFILNLLLIIVILGLIYKTIYVKLPIGNEKKNSFVMLILNTLFYIPCLANGLFDRVAKIFAGPYNTNEIGSLIMIVVLILLLVAYFKVPSLFNYVSTQGGKQLVNMPVSTDSQYNLGSYQDLNGNDEFNYQYAISCWVFIDSAPPNTNPNYNKYTSLLNFGNKPNILYNGSENSLMITMKQKDLKNISKNKLIDFDNEGNRILYKDNNLLLQKWNNIIINYNGGTMDIFLNGQLIKSSIEVVPYYTYDNLTIGENGGIKGGICNVVYFRNVLNSSNIYYLYNTVKNRTPPVLNDSNEAILVNDLTQTANSTETVMKTNL